MKWIPILILALLHLVAATAKVKEYKLSALAMILGSTLIIVESILSIINIYSNVYILIIGSLFIISSAIYNGYKDGNHHLSHHIIRILVFTFSMLIIV